MPELHYLQIEPIVSKALEEDWGYGDWTTDICVPEGVEGSARIITREKIVAAGLDVAGAVFARIDNKVRVTSEYNNGDVLASGETLLTLRGPARSLLRGERVALNFLARMCGIATKTREFVNALEGTKAQLLDTRKTTPGLRLLEKSSTVIGGARNHRFGLCDGVIVKENHIRAAGGIKNAVAKLLESLPPTLKVEVEATTLDEVQEALDAGADLIMLDNMSPSLMALAVRSVRGRAYLEASGNVTLENIREIAETGVDFISTGSIIHSARWSDLSMQFDV